ncbi:ThiF family adenylyltransferase, partial [Escherichia coli]|nr:ThiF family adenylyltransferase [Escherichia coli]
MSQERYSRQILFKQIGEIGQSKINQKCALIIGMGALGTHVAEGLVRAGIAKLIIVD